MNKIIDFNCTYDNMVGLNKEIAENTGLQFPEAHKEWDKIAQLALEMKKVQKTDFCQLPFCHTLEGEALGGIINYGDENIGPRGKEYICSSLEDLMALPEIDYTRGRIAEVLKACNFLRNKGENVILYVSGPFTILNILIEPRLIFKIFKKEAVAKEKILNKLQKEIFRFIEEGQKNGVNLISYGDAIGGLNIIGPKLTGEIVEIFTYPLLKRLEKNINQDSILLLCPKTTFALIGTNKAEWKDIYLRKDIKYTDACVEMIGKANIVGQMCVKNIDYKLKNGIIKTVNLL